MTTSATAKSGPKIFTLDEILAEHQRSSRITLIQAAGATELAVDSDPPPETLSDLLKKQTAVPSSTSIAAVPTNISQLDMQNLNDVLLLNSYISVASCRYLYNINPKGWDITDPAQASDFARASANAKFKILTDGLGSFLSLDTSSARNFHEETTSADLHLSFLTTLFGGFGFPASTMSELDGVLTSVNKTLDDLRLSWSDQSSTLDHLVFVYSFQPVPGLDMKLPQMRLFFLHIDQSSWTASCGKNSITHFEFNMNFDDNIFNMNPQQVESNVTEIQDLISTMTGQSFAAIQDLTSPKAVKADDGSEPSVG